MARCIYPKDPLATGNSEGVLRILSRCIQHMGSLFISQELSTRI